MELYSLTNEDIIFIYLSNRKFIEAYNNLINRRGLTSLIRTGDDSAIELSAGPLGDSEIEEILKNPHYLYCKTVDNKLESVVTLIQEALPELYEKVESSFSSRTI